MARTQRQRDLFGRGMTWMCGGALAFNILLIVGLLVLLAVNGLAYFWQKDLIEVELDDGTVYLGEVHEVETYREVADDLDSPLRERYRLRVGNRDLTGIDFVWVDDADIVERSHPREAVVLERLEWGNFYG